MKVVLFCGGKGMRLRDYSETIPKPLAEVGPHPILLHLMKYYAYFGHKEFILCLGHAGHAIKSYFRNFDEYLANDFVMSHGGREIELLRRDIDDWRITFVDTGPNTNIGQRLLRVQDHLEGDPMFLANYSDGLSDLDLDAYVEDFQKRDKIGSFVSVRAPYSFHMIEADDQNLLRSVQPINESDIRINGGFFAFKSEIFDHIQEGEELVLEPFERLSRERQIVAYPFDGFWQAMDTFKDKILLDDLWAQGRAPWRVWERPVARFGNGHARNPDLRVAREVVA
jgi:glucose-1-phosphate cytidylyltransferase